MARTLKENGPHPVDVHVGKQLRRGRRLQGMSQTKIADAVGLSFQQVQKYERGGNRIGASRLFEFAQALNVQVSYFFDNMPAGIAGDEIKGANIDHFSRPGTTDLVRAYTNIENPDLRSQILQLAKSLASHTKTQQFQDVD